MSGESVIRPRTDTDLPACIAALRRVSASDDYPSRWPDDPTRWLTPQGTEAAWVAPGVPPGEVQGHIVLRRHGDRVDGDGVDAAPPAWLSAEGLHPAQLAYVARLFVAPEARGSGVGAALLRAALERAQQRGWRAALEVAAEAGAAVRLYERAGWRRVTTGPAGWRTASGEQPLRHVYLSPPA